MQREILKEFIGGDLSFFVPVLLRKERREHKTADLMLVRPVRNDIQRAANHRHHYFDIVVVSEIVHADGRMNSGISALQDDLAFAVWQYRIGKHQDTLSFWTQTRIHVVEIASGIHI